MRQPPIPPNRDQGGGNRSTKRPSTSSSRIRKSDTLDDTSNQTEGDDKPGPPEHEEGGSTYSEIRRLIRNCDARHHTCVLARYHHGMEDMGKVGRLIRGASPLQLMRYLDILEDVVKSHRGCPLCQIKLVAFACCYCDGVRGDFLEFWRSRYQSCLKKVPAWAQKRNFLSEVREAIRSKNPSAVVHPTAIRAFLPRDDFAVCDPEKTGPW